MEELKEHFGSISSREPKEVIDGVDKRCSTCKHCEKMFYEEPCNTCGQNQSSKALVSKWEENKND